MLIEFKITNNKNLTLLERYSFSSFENNKVIDEWWVSFEEQIERMCYEPIFLKELKKQYFKTIANIKLSNNDFSFDKSELIASLKYLLTQYGEGLQASDPFEFTKEIFSKPFTFIKLIVLYIAHLKKPDLIKISSNDLMLYLDDIKNMKTKTFKQLINNINTNQGNVPLSNIIKLLEVGAFNSNNETNTIMLEYIARLLHNNTTNKTIKQQFGEERFKYFKSLIINSSVYKEHLEDIKINKSNWFNSNCTPTKNLKVFLKKYIKN